MNHTSTSPALAKAERGTAYKLARQIGQAHGLDTYTVLDYAVYGDGGHLTLSNGLG